MFIFKEKIDKDLFKKKIFVLVGILIIFLVGLIILGFWPVGTANGHIILAKEFNENYSLAYKIYEDHLKIYGQEDTSAMKSDDVKNEIKRATFQKLVEDRLIDDELRVKLGKDNFDQKINEKIQLQGLDKEEVKSGIKIAYALDIDSFKSLVLVPEAKKEILEGNLFMKGQNYNGWQKDQFAKAKVNIFIPGLYWDKGVKSK